MATPARYTAARIASRIRTLGREIARAAAGKRLDVVVMMDRSLVFAADLLREIDAPVVLHFVQEVVRDVDQGGRPLREIFFTNRGAVSAAHEYGGLKGRDVLLLDAVMESGITQEFVLRRLGESGPRSLRLAVLLDKPAMRRVALEPDYFGFQTASNSLWTGYGLSAPNGTGRNAKHLTVLNKGKQPQRRTAKRTGKKK